ncbi:MAG: hypothetical protein ACRDJ0_08325 [Actinomycetota bacterium]
MLETFIEEGRLDGFYLPASTLLYVDPDQIEALSGRAPAVRPGHRSSSRSAPAISNVAAAPEEILRLGEQLDEARRAAAEAAGRVADLEMRLGASSTAVEDSHREIAALKDSISVLESERNELAEVVTEARGLNDQLQMEIERLGVEAPAPAAAVEDLTAKLEEAVAAKSAAQKRLRKSEEELARLAEQLEAERARSSDVVGTILREKMALEESQREAAALKDSISALENERDELAAALEDARLIHDQLRSEIEREAPEFPSTAVEDLTIRLEEAVEARREAQERLRKGEEELAALAEQVEDERARASEVTGKILREKAALEDRVRVLETVVENRDESAVRNSEAVTEELRAALREKERIESELLRLRLRVKHFSEVEQSRDAALARLEHKLLESATLEAEVARLRARLDGLFDAESERDRLRLELDDANEERESTRNSVAELQVMVERIEEAEAERAELLAKLETALNEREMLEGEISPLRVELERLSQIEADRNRLAAQLETAQLERRVFDAEVHRVRAQTSLLEEELKRYKADEKRTARRRR